MRWRHKFLLILVTIAAGCISPPPPRPDGERVREGRSFIDHGTIELRRGRLAEAEAAYRIALELTPTAAALDGLGCVAFLRGDLAGAQTFFERAIATEPGYSQALGNVALLYEAKGDIVRAEAFYRAALGAEPRNFRARNNYAAFLRRGNDRTLLEDTRAELLKANAVARHPAIEANLVRNDKSDRSTYE